VGVDQKELVSGNSRGGKDGGPIRVSRYKNTGIQTGGTLSSKGKQPLRGRRDGRWKEPFKRR